MKHTMNWIYGVLYVLILILLF